MNHPPTYSRASGRTAGSGVRALRPLGAVTLALWLAGSVPAARGATRPAPGDPLPPGQVLSLSSDLRASVRLGREVVLEVRAADDDDWASLARRVSDDPSHAAALAAWNGDGPLLAGDWVRVPLWLTSDRYRSLVLRNLFPRDRLDGDAWVHVARQGALPTYDEGLWQVAQWFTGDGARFHELMAANRLEAPELAEGQAVRIPVRLLHPAFRPRPRSEDERLEFGEDGDGEFALYRLQPGEALYSAVVVRYTGRTSASDVRDVAETLRARNGIRNLRDIPAGFGVKIPFDVLEPEFLPESHPRRVEAEVQRAEVQMALERRPVDNAGSGLDGVVVVIDPGHGGRDLGTMNHGVWEHDYVYDVSCRLAELIRRETAARVVMTLIDTETGCRPSAQNQLVANRQGTIQTDPPFMARADGEAAVGVNLRWYLANSVYRRGVKDGIDPDRVLFLSLHADSRHPSLRGLMVYVPGAAYRSKTYGHSSAPYDRFAEVREKPHVRFSRSERLRSEAVSRRLADSIVEAFQRERLPVQPFQPVRNKVIRGQHKWLPAVLRGNEIPAKVLVEMVNLSNPDDAGLLAAARERQRLARALLRAIHDHFGEVPRPLAASTTTAP